MFHNPVSGRLFLQTSGCVFFLSGPRPRPAILCRAGYGRGRVLAIYNIENWRKSQCLVPPVLYNPRNCLSLDEGALFFCF